ncbi:hypothetical protein LTR80_011649, partial [Exophiala xenobiotica]
MLENGSLSANEKAIKAQNFSSTALLSSICAGSLCFALSAAGFFILSRFDRFDFVLEPRIHSYLNLVAKPFCRRPWRFVRNHIAMSNMTLMHDCGIEALFFDRYIRFLLLLFGSSAVVVTPAIMTFNYFLGSGDSVDILDRFSWTSLAPEQAQYYWIYAAFVPCFAGYTLVHITYELNRAVSVRLHLTKDHCRENGTNSRQFFVGVTGIPTDLRDERKIRAYYQHWERHIRSVRFVRSHDVEGDLSVQREQLIRSIERCETAFILKEVKLWARDKIDIQRGVAERLRHRYIGFSPYENTIRGRLLRAMSHWMPYEMQPVYWLYQTLVGINREIDRERRKFSQGASSALMEIDDYLIAQALSVGRPSMNASYLKVQYLG